MHTTTQKRHGGTTIKAHPRRIQRLLATAALALALAFAPCLAYAAPSPPISVPSGLLMTMDGHVLWSKNPTQVRHVASTIKMLNALVVREHANLDDVVTVTKKSEIANGGVRLVGGQRLTVRQLLDIMLIHSANDAAMALAIHVGGSEAKFVAMMNAKAKSLGLSHTHAIDPNGLSGRETSTANELATLGQRFMADPVLRSIVVQQKVSVPRLKGGPATYASSDLLMGHYVGLEGIKTGYTSGAGFCYVGAAKRGGVELLGVVLGTPSEAARFKDMTKLFDWGFAGTTVKQVVAAEEPHFAELGGKRVTLYASNAAKAIVFAQGGSVTKRVVATKQGATLLVSQGGAVIARVPLHAKGSALVGWLIGVGIVAVLVAAALGAWALTARRRTRERALHHGVARPVDQDAGAALGGERAPGRGYPTLRD